VTVSPEFWRATTRGYGVGQNDSGRERYLRKHRSLCAGYMCEERECEAGRKWRSTRPEAKWRAIDGEQTTVQPGMVQQGRPEDQPQGTPTGSEDDQAGLRVPLPPLPGRDRTGERTKTDDDGPATRTVGAAKTDEPVHGRPERRAPGVREGQGEERSSVEPTRAKDRNERPLPASPGLLPPMRAKDREGVAQSDGHALAFEAPVKKGGRPRKHVDDRARSRVYRERRRGQVGDPAGTRSALRKLGVERIVVKPGPDGWDFEGLCNLSRLVSNKGVSAPSSPPRSETARRSRAATRVGSARWGASTRASRFAGI